MKDKNPGLKMTDITKLVARSWRNIDDDKKAKYLRKEQAARTRYKLVMTEYKLSPNFKAHQRKLSEWKRKQKEVNNTSSNEPNTEQKNVEPPEPERMSEEKIKEKLKSKFKSYHQKIEEDPRTQSAKQEVSDAYASGLKKASKWITKKLMVKRNDISGALVAFRRLAAIIPNRFIMDFSCEGLAEALSKFEEKLKEFLSQKMLREKLKKTQVESLHGTLTVFQRFWERHKVKNSLKAMLSKMDNEWSFELLF